MPREVSSPGLWRRLCSTKLSSQAPSTTFFHHMQSGLIPTVRNGVMAVLAAFLGAEWGGGRADPLAFMTLGIASSVLLTSD